MNFDLAIQRLRWFYRMHKRLPSHKEFSILFGYKGKGGATTYLIKRLIDEGIIERDQTGQLVPKSILTIPKLGIVKAGFPTPADAQSEALDIFEYLLGIDGSIYSLTVKGDSMIDEGIHQGDVVIVNKDLPPKEGDIVVANVDGDWTVKFLQRDDYGKVMLVPANSEYPVIYPKDSLEIGGVVVSVIRKYR